jgi:hypothetical protein
MNFMPGEWWNAHIPEEGGIIDVVVLGSAPSIIIPEGGGEDLVIPQVRVRLEDDREIFVQEAALTERVEDASTDEG